MASTTFLDEQKAMEDEINQSECEIDEEQHGIDGQGLEAQGLSAEEEAVKRGIRSSAAPEVMEHRR